jgi:hypothetical protein
MKYASDVTRKNISPRGQRILKKPSFAPMVQL